MKFYIVSGLSVEIYESQILKILQTNGVDVSIVPPSEVRVEAKPDCCYFISTEIAHEIKWLGSKHDAVVYAIVNDSVSSDIPRWADDIVLLPPRALEIKSKIRLVDAFLALKQVGVLTKTVKDIVEKVKSDLELAQTMQKRLIPERFPPIFGIKTMSRYLCGARSGGDYFDVFEFNDKSHVGMLMTDSSTYGLSSAFLSVLMKVALKLNKEDSLSPSKTMSKLLEDIMIGMNDRETLSLCYMILSKKDYKLKYVIQGSGTVFHISQNGKLRMLDKVAETGVRSNNANPEAKWIANDSEIVLEPKDRIVMLSDGFREAFTSIDELSSFIEKSKSDEPEVIANELIYRIKTSEVYTSQGMPGQDCSVVVFDVGDRIIRLTTS